MHDSFDTLVKPILLYSSELYGIHNYKAAETFYLAFLKKTLGVKQTTNTCMVLCKNRKVSIIYRLYVKSNMIKLHVIERNYYGSHMMVGLVVMRNQIGIQAR